MNHSLTVQDKKIEELEKRLSVMQKQMDELIMSIHK